MNKYFEPALNLMLQNWWVFGIIILLVFLMVWAKAQLHGSFQIPAMKDRKYTCAGGKNDKIEMEWIKGYTRTIAEWRKTALYLAGLNKTEEGKNYVKYLKSMPDSEIPSELENVFGIKLKKG